VWYKIFQHIFTLALTMPVHRAVTTLALVFWLCGLSASTLSAETAPTASSPILPAPFTAQTVLPPEYDAQTALAHRIFQHLLRAGDRNPRVQPQLFIVSNRFQPWAVALPGGQIVLSRRVLEIALTAPTPPEAEARLAFVLGHELTHLLKDDY
jgi:Zn-dependent protease with chaperone function